MYTYIYMYVCVYDYDGIGGYHRSNGLKSLERKGPPVLDK